LINEHQRNRREKGPLGHSPAGAHRHRHHCGITGIIFRQKWELSSRSFPQKMLTYLLLLAKKVV
jgi:hypothetical protein